MQIHVVRTGETLPAISQMYGATVDEIVRANELPAGGGLVVGQALVIPIIGSYYTVKPGDSLYTIARKEGISAAELARINHIPLNKPLQVGQRLYIPERPKRSAEMNAYVETRKGTVPESLIADTRKAAPQLTYLAPFSFRIQRGGSVSSPNLNDFERIARENRNTLMMVVTNIEKTQFSTELASVILTDQTVQNKLLDNIIATARRLGFQDIHFDLERISPDERENYNAFLRKAKQRISQEGFLMSTALAPKTSAEQRGQWYTAHDYKAHGEIADFVVLMTYEWGYSGGPPLPVSPIGPVRRVLTYALSEMPASKIMMGQNLYGYDWTLPYVRGTKAKAISPQAAIDLARKENVEIHYDEKQQAPYFNYTDDAGKRHIVWFEDARSIQAKFDLVKELSLRGVSYWKLGLPFPQNWLLIRDNFSVVKRKQA